MAHYRLAFVVLGCVVATLTVTLCGCSPSTGGGGGGTVIPPPECEFDSECDDEVFCNGDEQCDSGECIDGPSPCTNQCLEAERRCPSCEVDADCEDDDPCTVDQCVTGDCEQSSLGECCEDSDCDDDEFCTGVETCQSGSCVAGEPPCSPGEACNEVSDNCETTENAPPVADAGPDLGAVDSLGLWCVPVGLDASASTDTDGSIVSYSWSEAGLDPE